MRSARTIYLLSAAQFSSLVSIDALARNYCDVIMAAITMTPLYRPLLGTKGLHHLATLLTDQGSSQSGHPYPLHAPAHMAIFVKTFASRQNCQAIAIVSHECDIARQEIVLQRKVILSRLEVSTAFQNWCQRPWFMSSPLEQIYKFEFHRSLSAGSARTRVYLKCHWWTMVVFIAMLMLKLTCWEMRSYHSMNAGWHVQVVTSHLRKLLCA